MTTLPATQWWLAELNEHGNAKITDGPHDDRAGVEQALYLIRRLGLDKGRPRRYASAQVLLTEVLPVAHDVNHEAVATLNGMGLRP